MKILATGAFILSVIIFPGTSNAQYYNYFDHNQWGHANSTPYMIEPSPYSSDYGWAARQGIRRGAGEYMMRKGYRAGKIIRGNPFFGLLMPDIAESPTVDQYGQW